MGTVSLSGNDTTMINNRIFADLADGDCVVLDFPNDIANVKTGKNGNSIFSLNESGKQCNVVVRVLKASADDKYLNNLLAQQQSNFAGKILDFGEFIKKVGDGQGNVANDTYIMSGGVFTKMPGAKNNVEGDSEQSITTYTFMFSNAPRVVT